MTSSVPAGADYVKCRVCKCAMRRTVATDHIARHREAGHLVMEAHNDEMRELREEER